ncbi:AAA family ATPase [Streptomyces ferrugineus]|uniref:AAA family ATPase n=1 Tax=Streptomyces ferrugineus TaxID=1413221 RepID=A0A7M2SQE7_9ACTN|nr:P-loop NTPase fold protein [Streptomyces ferrugineus]QOV38580.1 AAA family ATPase [Streptomyces ferrugineus]
MLLTDNPVNGSEGDRFGFLPHSRVLCDAINATRDLPLSVALYGAWGTGKSSFMNICRSLLQEQGIPVVSFNPWKYDQREEIWHALIQTILDEIAARITEDPDAKRSAQLQHALKKAAALSRTAAWLMTRKAAVPLTAGLVSTSDADALKDAWDNGDPLEYRHVNQFEHDFAEVVEQFTGGGRLVILIDDLDRCTPEAATTVLDSLKLFLGEASCVFVLAMDQQVIAKAVAQRFDGDEEMGRKYLEKLIQFPYHLPHVTFESMFSHLSEEVLGLRDDPALWQLIRVAYGQNPRRVRRFINALNLTVISLRLHSTPSRARMLHAAILLTIRLQHPAFYAMVNRSPESWQRMDEAANGNTNVLHMDEDTLFNTDTDLADLLRATSSRTAGLDFPPPPGKTEIDTLTEVLSVTTGGAMDPVTGHTTQGEAQTW